MAGSMLRWRYCHHKGNHSSRSPSGARRSRPRTNDVAEQRPVDFDTQLLGSYAELVVDNYLRALTKPDDRTNSHEVVGFTRLERAFTLVARAYGQRLKISHSTWISVGVPTDVLANAGITPDQDKLTDC